MIRKTNIFSNYNTIDETFTYSILQAPVVSLRANYRDQVQTVSTNNSQHLVQQRAPVHGRLFGMVRISSKRTTASFFFLKHKRN